MIKNYNCFKKMPHQQKRHNIQIYSSNKNANDNNETESNHSQRKSFLALDLKNTENDINMVQINNFCEKISDQGSVSVLSNNIFNKDNSLINDYEENDSNSIFFSPKISMFGAPMCRWTSSVLALIGIMSGIILTSSGVCILFFFVDEEPTIFPLGITLSIVGILLLILGGIMWISEFMCNHCLDKLHTKIRNAHIKNAIRRRSRMTSRASNIAQMIVEPRYLSKLADQTNDSNCSITNLTRY